MQHQEAENKTWEVDYNCHIYPHLHAGRYWAMVEKFKVTHFCTIPYVLEKLKSYGDDHVKKHDLSSLKIIAVGMFYHTISDNHFLSLTTMDLEISCYETFI